MLPNSSKFTIRRGFTLLEVMIAITVMTLAIAGSFILIQQTLVAGALIQSRLIAGYLTQEGFEIIRNIRDSNWLEQRGVPEISWDKGISGTLDPGHPPADFIADYTSQSLADFEDRVLSLDADGFYSYSSGQPTIFKRKITVSKIDADSIKVEILVSWSERGRSHQISAREYLYNWKP